MRIFHINTILQNYKKTTFLTILVEFFLFRTVLSP